MPVSSQVEVEEEMLRLKEENQELKEKLEHQRVDLERCGLGSYPIVSLISS